jgi:hypothetical protein
MGEVIRLRNHIFYDRWQITTVFFHDRFEFGDELCSECHGPLKTEDEQEALLCNRCQRRRQEGPELDWGLNPLKSESTNDPH